MVNLAILRSPGEGSDRIIALPMIPRYLVERYWWAYLHPRAIAFFDNPWIEIR